MGVYRGHKPTMPHRQRVASSLRKLAADSQAAHPEVAAHQHYRDAASSLEAGDYETAQEHLRAAMFHMTPQSMHRLGIHDDNGHIAARQAMQGAHRHLLLVKGIERIHQRNEEHAEQMRAERGPVTGEHMPDPGALAQRPGAKNPAAMNAPARTNAGRTGPDVAKPDSPEPRGSKQIAAAGSWDELAAVLELSADTARLASTPAPRGRPGGPGLYGVKGQKHSDYMEQVVKALIEKRGMPEGKAYAIARASLRKWGARSKHAEVRSAASAAEAEESSKHGAHSHAVTWDDLAGVIELGFNPAQPRVAAGSAAGGQFAPPGAAPASQKQTPAQGKAAKKAALLKQAKQDRQRAAALLRQIGQIQAKIRAAQKGTGKVRSTKTNVTKSAAPAKKGQAATTASAAQQAKTASAKAGTAAKGAAKAAAGTGKAQTVAQMKKQLVTLHAQVHALLAKADALSKQAAHLANDGPAVELAAIGGHHVPGTSYDWRHTWIPLTESAARSHYGGKIPASWHPAAGGAPERSAEPSGPTYRERRAAKAERLRGWAEKREERANSTLKAGEPYRSDPAFIGQPGHIPARARIIDREDRAYESLRKAESMKSRAAGIEKQMDRAIYSDDPDAVSNLRDRIAELEAGRAKAKAVNAAFKAKNKAALAKMDAFDRDRVLPYPAYHFQNLSGNISRQRKRLAELESKAARL